MTTDFEQQINNQTVFKMDADFLQQAKGLPMNPSTMSSNHMSISTPTSTDVNMSNMSTNSNNTCDNSLMHCQENNLFETKTSISMQEANSVGNMAVASSTANQSRPNNDDQDSLMRDVNSLVNDRNDLNKNNNNNGHNNDSNNNNNNMNNINSNGNNIQSNNNSNSIENHLGLTNNICGSGALDGAMHTPVQELNALTSVLNSQIQLAVQQQQQQQHQQSNNPSLAPLHQNNQRQSPLLSIQQNLKIGRTMTPDKQISADKLLNDFQVIYSFFPSFQTKMV